jgi:hypothetical protein
MTVILDISRLISRIRHATPSGVDRVEMAYARGLLARYGDALAFAAVHPLGGYGRVPRAAALAYLDELERRWASHEDAPARRSLLSVLPQLLALWPTRKGIGGIGNGAAIYVQASPHHLTKGALVRRILARENARFLCLVHDLIPIEFPEYARPSGAALHRLRMEAVASACAASGGRHRQFGGDGPGAGALAGAGNAGSCRPARHRGTAPGRARTGRGRAPLFRLPGHDRAAQEPPAAAPSLAPSG